MAVSDDKRIQEVAAFGVLEWLGNDKQRLEKARTLMRNNTRKMSDEVEKFWRRE